MASQASAIQAIQSRLLPATVTMAIAIVMMAAAGRSPARVAAVLGAIAKRRSLG